MHGDAASRTGGHFQKLAGAVVDALDVIGIRPVALVGIDEGGGRGDTDQPPPILGISTISLSGRNGSR